MTTMEIATATATTATTTVKITEEIVVNTPDIKIIATVKAHATSGTTTARRPVTSGRCHGDIEQFIAMAMNAITRAGITTALATTTVAGYSSALASKRLAGK